MQPWQPGQQPQDSHTYGPPQTPPKPYGQRYAPQQPPPYTPPPSGHAAPQQSRGLAITALVAGVSAAVIAFTPLAAIAIVLGAIAAILAVITFFVKTQSGKMLAAGGLAAGMAAFPVAFVMWSLRTDQAATNRQQQDCMTEQLEKGADVNVDELWNC